MNVHRATMKAALNTDYFERSDGWICLCWVRQWKPSLGYYNSECPKRYIKSRPGSVNMFVVIFIGYSLMPFKGITKLPLWLYVKLKLCKADVPLAPKKHKETMSKNSLCDTQWFIHFYSPTPKKIISKNKLQIFSYSGWAALLCTNNETSLL